MKKVLSTIAALGLVAGLASTAAAVEFKMSGKYSVEGTYLSNFNNFTLGSVATAPLIGPGGIMPVDQGAANHSDSWYMHTFEIKPTMQVNDKVSMVSVIRLADRTFWGTQTGGDAFGNNMYGNDGKNNVYVHQLYMNYDSPIGKFVIGRTPAGGWGTAFMDFDQRADRIQLFPSFLASGPVTTQFFMEKSKDNIDGKTGTEALPGTDADYTKYVARAFYKNDNLDSGLEYAFKNNKTVATVSDQLQDLSVYGKFKMDNYFANAELTHFFGSKDYDASTALLKRDYDSWAAFLQGGVKIDALTASLAYAYAQGQDPAKDVNGGDMTNALGTTGTGDQFEPLYVLTGRSTGILNNYVYSGLTATASKDGMHAIVAAADYAVSNQLTLHGAIGWAKADETQILNQNNTYGWEYDLGAAYKLLDNLTYEAHFGYLDTGDYFNMGNATDITKNVYVLSHSLTMTF